MKKNKSIAVDAITMEKIRISGATISGHDGDDDLSEFVIQFNVNQSADPDGKRVKIDLEFDISAEVDPAVNANFSLEFVFMYPFLDDHISGSKESGLLLDSQLVATLVGLAYSTSRGIIYTRCLGTPLQNTILPVISPSDYLPKQ